MFSQIVSEKKQKQKEKEKQRIEWQKKREEIEAAKKPKVPKSEIDRATLNKQLKVVRRTLDQNKAFSDEIYFNQTAIDLILKLSQIKDQALKATNKIYSQFKNIDVNDLPKGYVMNCESEISNKYIFKVPKNRKETVTQGLRIQNHLSGLKMYTYTHMRVKGKKFLEEVSDAPLMNRLESCPLRTIFYKDGDELYRVESQINSSEFSICQVDEKKIPLLNKPQLTFEDNLSEWNLTSTIKDHYCEVNVKSKKNTVFNQTFTTLSGKPSEEFPSIFCKSNGLFGKKIGIEGTLENGSALLDSENHKTLFKKQKSIAENDKKNVTPKTEQYLTKREFLRRNVVPFRFQLLNLKYRGLFSPQFQIGSKLPDLITETKYSFNKKQNENKEENKKSESLILKTFYPSVNLQGNNLIWDESKLGTQLLSWSKPDFTNRLSRALKVHPRYVRNFNHEIVKQGLKLMLRRKN